MFSRGSPLPPFFAGRWRLQWQPQWQQPAAPAAPAYTLTFRRIFEMQGVITLSVALKPGLELYAPALKGAVVGAVALTALESVAFICHDFFVPGPLVAALAAAASPAAAFFAAAGGGGAAAAACAAALAQLARRAAGAPRARGGGRPGALDCKVAGAVILAGLALSARGTLFAATRASVAAGLAAYAAVWLWGSAADRWLRPPSCPVSPRVDDAALKKDLAKAVARVALLALATSATKSTGGAIACLALLVAYDTPA